MSTPFDLHVLSTPPAFILSQDQTLNKMVSKELSFLKSILLKLNSSFKEIINGCLYKLFWAFTTNSFWCFVFVMLFNLQGAHRFQRRAFILPQRFFFVKHFFKLFQTRSRSHSQIARWGSPPSRTAYRGYHSWNHLSSTFFKFFQTFSCSFGKNLRGGAALADSL